MNRCFAVRRPCALLWLVQAVALLTLLGLAGCMHQKPRLQSEEESDKDRYGIETIGDKTMVANVQPRQIAGVGLVVGLEGTGAEAVNDEYRGILEDQLKKRGVKEIKKELNSPNHALVLVTAFIPPGACKGDPVDVDVVLPAHSNVRSLRGGYLRECFLLEYASTHELSPNFAGADGKLPGHKLGVAEGPVLISLGDGPEEARVKQGRVWGGGHLFSDNPLVLSLNQDQQFGRVAKQVADRLNVSFQGGPRGLPGAEVAHAKDNIGIDLRVPAQYRHNLQRFLRVARLVPLHETLEGSSSDADHRSYRQKLADDLLEPSRAVVAALRLEALGPTSIPALKAGLESKHPLVRFCSAESLAYLGSPSGADELASAVKNEPMFRAFGLTAFASLDEGVSFYKLGELIASPIEDEVRYGAFRALKTLNMRNPDLHGVMLNDSYWLHCVAPGSQPLVHITSSREAEIVLFGEEPCLKKPFRLMAGAYVLTATEDDDRCWISKFTPLRTDPDRRQCAFSLKEVLHAMADLGASYPEVVEMLHEAEGAACVSCRVRCDALPQATSVYDLQKAGAGTMELRSANGASTAVDLGATPTLYEAAPGQPRK